MGEAAARTTKGTEMKSYLGDGVYGESFERAAYALTHALQNYTPMLDVNQLEKIVMQFGEQVTRFRDVVAALTDNMDRAHREEAMAFDGDTIQRI